MLFSENLLNLKQINHRRQALDLSENFFRNHLIIAIEYSDEIAGCMWSYDNRDDIICSKSCYFWAVCNYGDTLQFIKGNFQMASPP